MVAVVAIITIELKGPAKKGIFKPSSRFANRLIRIIPFPFVIKMANEGRCVFPWCVDLA